MTVFRIEQQSLQEGKYLIRLVLRVPGKAERRAETTIEFGLTPQEQEDLRWYLEDFLQVASDPAQSMADQIMTRMHERGVELYRKVFTADANTQALWFAVRDQLANLRVEISTSVAEAASIPWELMHDPELDSPIALRVKAFVRVPSDPNIGFVEVPPVEDGRLRLLYIACRPGGSGDVALRAIANRLLQDLGPNLARFEITALRPPTLERLEAELTRAKAVSRPYHIVHFDGHGVYEDLSTTKLSDWLGALSSVTLGGAKKGKHGYLLFEHPETDEKMRPVDGETLGKLLHDHGASVLVLNACQSAMHEAVGAPTVADGSGVPATPPTASVHDEIRAIGSLAQAVIDQGIPAVLGMRYSVYVVTAAQYIGALYRALADGQSFGEAASSGRKHLQLHPERWLGLQPRVLQDWFVPVVYEAMPIKLLTAAETGGLDLRGIEERDPAQLNAALRRYVPDHGFVGRDETLLALDRAFDEHHIVLLHAYAGQGKTTAAVEFARWYGLTGGLGLPPVVLLSSFEQHQDIASMLNQVARIFADVLEANNILWHALNDAGKRRQIVLQLLRAIPVLWIWDNVEPIAGFPTGAPSQWTAAEQEDLRDFLKQIKIDNGSKVKILLTSRRDEQSWLGTLPHRIKMPRMSAADAATLARQIGGEKHIPRSEIDDWQPLLDYCAGNPLTLRVLIGQAVRMGLRGKRELSGFVEAIRSGEKDIQDADASEGRDHSLGASLDYGFKNAFLPHDLPILALLHLFQGTVFVEVLEVMGAQHEYALIELQGRDEAHLTDLLIRAAEAGLITQADATLFTIHPALPWFLRQLFAKCYDGEDGRSSTETALRAWLAAVAELGSHYQKQFCEGNFRVVPLLELQEGNLLKARLLARRRGFWHCVTGAMQGLRILYQYQGRNAEWARLVAEVVPAYCTVNDEPIRGRENDYSLIMGHRINLAQTIQRDVPLASALQAKVIMFERERAAEALAVPAGSPLSELHRNRIRSLAISFEILGELQREADEAGCINHFNEAIALSKRIEDRALEATAEFNLGHAYKDVRLLRNLDDAEAAYQRSLGLTGPREAINRAGCFYQLSLIYHARFIKALEAKELETALLGHLQKALYYCQEALINCPETAPAELGPPHLQMGRLFSEFREWDHARKHFEKAATYFEKTGNRYSAGAARINMASMYFRASAGVPNSTGLHDYLNRAQAYAEAALRDFQYYQGHAITEEDKARNLVEIIHQKIRTLRASQD